MLCTIAAAAVQRNSSSHCISFGARSFRICLHQDNRRRKSIFSRVSHFTIRKKNLGQICMSFSGRLSSLPKALFLLVFRRILLASNALSYTLCSHIYTHMLTPVHKTTHNIIGTGKSTILAYYAFHALHRSVTQCYVNILIGTSLAALGRTRHGTLSGRN